MLPQDFRRRLSRKAVLLVERDDKLEVYPADSDLSKYFDLVEVDASGFEDYHSLRRIFREVHRC